jgi:hypothetical protein
LKVFRDNINLLILLLFGSLVYITAYRGHWTDQLKPGETGKLKLSGNIFLLPSYTLADHTEFTLSGELTTIDNCVIIDSLFIVVKTKSETTYRNLTPSEICIGKSVTFSESFRFVNNFDRIDVKFTIKEHEKPSSVHNTYVEKGKKFELRRKNRFDFIILLYPALWITFGVLVLVKLTRLIREKKYDDEL